MLRSRTSSSAQSRRVLTRTQCIGLESCSSSVVRTTTSIVTLALVLNGCHDSVNAPRDLEPSRQQSSSLGGVQDGGFDPSDTYARVEFSVERSYDLRFPTGMVDAITGAVRRTAHVQRPTERFRLEAGYDRTGDPRYVVTRLAASGDPTRALVDPPAVTILTPRGATVYAATGALLADWTSGATMASAGATRSTGISSNGALSASTLASLGMTRSSNVLEGLTGPAALDVRLPGAGAAAATPTGTSGMPGVVQTRITTDDGATVVRRFVTSPDGASKLDAVDLTETRPAYGGLEQIATHVHVTSLMVRSTPARDAARAAARMGEVASGVVAPSVCAVSAPSQPAERATVTADCSTPGDPPPADPPPPPNYFAGQLPIACAGAQYCDPPQSPTPCTLDGTNRYCLPFPPKSPPLPNIPTWNTPGIYFQHGAFSDASTWNWMRMWAGPDYPASPVQAFTLTSRAPLAQQAYQLAVAFTQPTVGAPGNYIFVGHSQGGLISRDYYQRWSNSPFNRGRDVPIRGVITIGTPHIGAPLAANAPALSAAVRAKLYSLQNSFCYGGLGSWVPGGCTATTFVGAWAETKLDSFADPRVALNLPDISPRSAYLFGTYGINKNPEPFARAAIQSYAAKRWVWARLAAEALQSCAPLNTDCNGQAWVDRINSVYTASQACEAIGLTGRLGSLWRLCSQARQNLDSIDLTWDINTTSGDPTTDGVVPGASQLYPTLGPRPI